MPSRAGLGDQLGEIVLGTQLRMDGGVPALRRTDGPRATRVLRPGLQRIACPFAMDVPDGVDRREVEDVESHGGHPIELADHTSETSEGTGEQLVPGRELRQLPLHPHRQLAASGLIPRRDHAVDQRRHAGVEGRVEAHLRRAHLASQRGDTSRDPRLRLVVERATQGLEQLRPDFELHGELLPGDGAFGQISAPTGEAVGPSDHLYVMQPRPLRCPHTRKAGLPIVAHGGGSPRSALGPPAQRRRQHVVAVFQQRRRHLDRPRDRSLRRVVARLRGRLHVDNGNVIEIPSARRHVAPRYRTWPDPPSDRGKQRVSDGPNDGASQGCSWPLTGQPW